MKTYLSFLIISTVSFSSSGQINQSKKTEPESVLDSIISIAKTQSISKNAVDWSALEKKILKQLKNDGKTQFEQRIEYDEKDN